jgi:SAM-dependent methyltransferase
MNQNINNPEEPVNDFYENFYDRTFNGDGINGWAYRKTHKDLEAYFSSDNSRRILEIGAGKAQHIQYVRQSFSEYVMVDLNQAPHKFEDSRISWIQGNIENLEFAPNSFDRVISMCVFHHLDNPAKVMRLINTWLKPGGIFSLFLPMDPSFANRVNRKLLVSPRTRKLGFKNYEIVNALEHRNHYWGLRTLLMSSFANYGKKILYKPLGLRIPGMNLYTIWQLRKPEK